MLNLNSKNYKNLKSVNPKEEMESIRTGEVQ